MTSPVLRVISCMLESGCFGGIWILSRPSARSRGLSSPSSFSFNTTLLYVAGFGSKVFPGPLLRDFAVFIENDDVVGQGQVLRYRHIVSVTR